MLETLESGNILINLIPATHTMTKKVVKLLSFSRTACCFYFHMYLYSCRPMEQDLEVNIFMKTKKAERLEYTPLVLSSL